MYYKKKSFIEKKKYKYGKYLYWDSVLIGLEPMTLRLTAVCSTS